MTMRIAYLCFDEGIPIGGDKGASIHVSEMVRALSDIGHEVLLIGMRGRAPENWANIHVEILARHEFSEHILQALVAERLAGNREFSRDLRDLITPLLHQGKVARILTAFRPDVIYERYTELCIAGTILAEVMELPLLLEVNSLIDEAVKWRGLELIELAMGLERLILSRATIRIVVSSALRAAVREIVGTSLRTVILPNAVDALRFSPVHSGEAVRARYSIGHDEFVIGYIGTFRPWHDMKTLLTAFEQFSHRFENSHLLLVGRDRDLRIKALVDSEGTQQRITVTGPVDHNCVPKHIAAMDIAVVPFKHDDGHYFSPIKLFEYMAMEKCVVASEIGQATEVLTHGYNGWLYSPESVSQLLDSFTVLHSAPEMRHTLGQNARKTVEAGFTWLNNAEVVTNLIRDLL